MIMLKMGHLDEGGGAADSNVLESVKVEGSIVDLSCDLVVEQVFQNGGDHNIEAVYTFPLPHDGVLLDLMATIGDRDLRGTVMPKKAAGERYEEAVAEGDGAIMLEQTDDGVCTVNLGNLMPGERATLIYRFAFMLEWQQDTVRFSLPTTIAPRYGDPIAAGYQPHQVPVTDILAENRFGLRLEITGLLSGAMADSPTHRVAIRNTDGTTEVTLMDGHAFMDRDFVLNLKANGAVKSAGRFTKDPVSGGFVARATFCPEIPGSGATATCVKVVVDCSGSMAGDSIVQARAGLHRILDSLRPHDTFNVIRFGNSQSLFFPDCVPANDRNLKSAREAVDRLDADMGGTEIAAALRAAYRQRGGSDLPAAVLLITDGQVSMHRDVTREAIKSGQRVFTVGVGSSVARDFVDSLADTTGGACELVTPGEGMADAIWRQFRRMFQPKAVEARIEWPGEASWQTPEKPASIFSGDTLHAYAGFRSLPDGEAVLHLRLEDGREYQQGVILEADDTLQQMPRVAMSSRIREISKDAPALAGQLALDYQLVTDLTSFLIIDVKAEDEKAAGLPQLARVSQMLAAGWGGTGTVHSAFSHTRGWINLNSQLSSVAAVCSIAGGIHIPAFLRKQLDVQPVAAMQVGILSGVIGSAMRSSLDPGEKDSDSHRDLLRQKILIVLESGDGWLAAFRELAQNDFTNDLKDAMAMLADDEGWGETAVAAAALLALLQRLCTGEETGDWPDRLRNLAGAEVLADYLSASIRITGKRICWRTAYECMPAA
jgi:Ca-activated chloride channel family protein